MNQKNNLSYSKKELSFSVVESCGTYVIAAVSSSIKEENKVNFLSCKGLMPLGDLVYDTASDSYAIECVDVMHIGTIPVSLSATVKGCPHWTSTLPVPERVIKKYLKPKQRRELEGFFSAFDGSFSKFYIQMLDPNPCS